MSGKKTNTIIALTNIFLGLIFIVFNYIYTSAEPNFNRYDVQIFNYLKISLFSLVIIINLLNLVYSIISIWSGRRFMLYLLSLFSLLVFIPLPKNINYVFPAFLVISGIIILIRSRKNNYIEKDSFWVITLNILLVILMTLSLLGVVFYKQIGEVIKSKEEVNLVKYSDEFFQFIVPLKDNKDENSDKYKEIFVNAEKNGKYGYINNKGEVLIDFKYDFATPFYKIKAFDKEFYIASVSEGNLSKVVMKDLREVMTYNSEYTSENPELKLKEFEKILKNTIKQKPEDITTEASKEHLNLVPRRVYKEKSTGDYTYRFDFNDKYDIFVLESSMGNPTKYSIGKKGSDSTPKELDVEHLIYDPENLYVFSSGDLPYYSPSKHKQGWITKSGKKLNLEGNAEILDVKDNYILINNLSKNKVYFVDKELNQISKYYKEVIKYKDTYVVRKDEGIGRWIILDKNLKQKFKEEYDIFSPKLLSDGLYIFANIDKTPKFNELGYIDLNYIVLNKDFKVIANQVKNVYNLNSRLINRDNPDDIIDFMNDLRSSKMEYASDKYYKKEEAKEEPKKEKKKTTQTPEKIKHVGDPEDDLDKKPNIQVLDKAFSESN